MAVNVDLSKAFVLGIKTIRELGSNKFFAVAGVLLALEGKAD